MAKRLISTNAEGLNTFHDYDPSTGRAYRIYEQDCSPSLEYSKALQRDESFARQGIKNEMQMVAHYPAIVVMKLLTEHGCNPIQEPARALAIAKVHFPDCLTVKPSSVAQRPKRQIILAK